MENERDRKPEDQVKDLDNLDVTEVDDKDLEDASGGVASVSDRVAPGNYNCGC